MSKVLIYTTRYCGYCYRAKQLLSAKGVSYEEVPVDGDRPAREDLLQRTGSATVPQIWIGDTYVGGSDALFALEQQGALDALLQK